jgi:hypothetical protein
MFKNVGPEYAGTSNVIRVEERVENITTHLLGSIASLMENGSVVTLTVLNIKHFCNCV